MFDNWLSEEDRKLDVEFGIERQPKLGCFIVTLGTILFWCGIYWLWITLS